MGELDSQPDPAFGARVVALPADVHSAGHGPADAGRVSNARRSRTPG